MRYLAFVLLCLGTVSADEIKPVPDPINDQIHLPTKPVTVQPDEPAPNPPSTVIGTLKPDQWYVIESTAKLITLSSPEGLVAFEESQGPIRVRGLFVDGSGKIETRTYNSPYVYFVTAVASGKTELILIPEGVTSQDDIVRQVLTVSGIGPRPGPEPPTPDPDDPPIPPGPVSSFRVIFVVESGDTLNAKQTAIAGAAEIRNYLTAKTTPEGGLAGWRQYDPQQTTANEQPTIKKLWDAVKQKLLPAPCLVIETNGTATVMAYPADVSATMAILKKARGE